MRDWKNAPRWHRPRDPVQLAELRGLFVGLIYGAAIGLVILAPLWAQLLDQGTR